MSNNTKISIRFFDDREVRAIWDEENNKWWFNVVDIVAVLTDQDDYTKTRNYWKYLKAKLKKENSELGSITTQLKLTASDGKKYLTDTFDSDGIITLAKHFPNNKGRIVDFEVSERLDLPAYRRIADRLKVKFRIKYLCTDGNWAYDKIKMALRHVIGKSETCFVESANAKIRRKLARFNRKTCRYSKAIDMVAASLTLLFNEDLIMYIFS